MHFKIDVAKVPMNTPPVIGNAYISSSDYGRHAGDVAIIIAITKDQLALMLLVDKTGEPIGTTSYSLRALEHRVPIAFVEGLENLNLVMVPLK